MKTTSLKATLLLLVALGLPGFALAHTNIHHFLGGNDDGASPQGSLTLVGSYLYGMTKFGGSSNKGTLFKIGTEGGGFSIVHTFLGGTNDGAIPLSSLTLDGATLYGGTVNGGTGQGAIFKINTDGSGFELLHSFSPSPSDGWGPISPVTISGATLYGMTQLGGSGADNGTIYKMNTNGTGFMLLHSFAVTPNDGRVPRGALVLSGDVLYGMTPDGGAFSGGTIFKINTDGTGYSVLRDFTFFGNDGRRPAGTPILIGSNLFGVTLADGTNSGSGTIFSINTNGTGFQVLHTFYGSRDGATGAPTDGAEPNGSLVLFGNSLFGMTRQGGRLGQGAIFKINTDGTGFTVIDSFEGRRDGSYPIGDVTFSISGDKLFGMTPEGGTNGTGTIFSVDLNRPPLADASATATLFLSANGSNAVVMLDGSRSSDPDGNRLEYQWYVGNSTEPAATGVVALAFVPIGTNTISLVVSDGTASATNTIVVEVITLGEAVDRLVATVASDVTRSQPLISSLNAAIASIDRSNPTAALNELEAFQNKVRVQLESLDPDLAGSLISRVQEVINSLSDAAAKPRLGRLLRQADGKLKMQFSAPTGSVYLIAASTNLADWEVIGVAAGVGDGSFEFEDNDAPQLSSRFYRIISR